FCRIATAAGIGQGKYMFRYIGLSWNSERENCNSLAQTLAKRISSGLPGWCLAFAQPGLQVYCTSAGSGMHGAQPLSGGSGVILGRVFRRNTDLEDCSPHSGPTFGPEETARILDSQGRRLTSEYWGRYVAFGYDSNSNTHWILKDPLGNLPCYITTAQGLR